MVETILRWSSPFRNQVPGAGPAVGARPGAGGINPDDLWVLVPPMAALVVVLLIIAVAIAIAMQWYRQTKDPEISVHYLMSEFRQLEKKGQLSTDEFKKIKLVLGEKLKADAGAAAKGSAPAAKPKDAVTTDPPPAAKPNDDPEKDV